MKLSNIAFRNVFRNGRRSILSGVAIAVAAFSITMLFSMLEGMKYDLRYNLQTFVSGEVRIRNPQYNEHEMLSPLHLGIPEAGALTDRIEADERVTLASPRIRYPGIIFLGDEDYRAVGLGVDLEREEAFQDLSTRLVAGRLPRSGENEAVLGAGLAARLGLSIGDRFTVLSTTRTRGSNAMTFDIVGTAVFPLAQMTENEFITPLDRTQYFLRMDDSVTEILLKLEPGADDRAVAAGLSESLSAGRPDGSLVAQSWRDISASYSLIQVAEVMYGLIALFFFVLGSTVIVNTTMMVVYERMREIGTLAAIGMEGGALMRLFLLEALIISTAGALVGVLAGIGVTLPLSRIGLDFSSSMSGMDLEISSILYPRVNLRSTVFVFLYSVTVASLASLFPSRKAATVDPVEALRTV